MEGVKGLWALQVENSVTDNILVLSFVGETRYADLSVCQV